MIAVSWRRRVSLGVERLWFEPVRPELYAVLRIVFGILGVVAIAEFTPVPMFWALDGIAPLPGEGFGIRGTLLESGLSSTASWVYFVGLLSAYISMAVGYKTSLSILVAFAGTSALTPWNHLPLSSAIQVLTSVLFCLWWADCAGAPSVDAWLARRRGAPGAVGARLQPIWPLRLLRIQVCIIYLNTGLWKLLHPLWRDGTAVHYAINQNIFHRFPYELPYSFDWLTTLATYVTLVWEIGFAVLILHPVTRYATLALGVILHGGMWVLLELGPFSWMMIATYVGFFDPAMASNWVNRVPSVRPGSDGATTPREVVGSV